MLRSVVLAFSLLLPGVALATEPPRPMPDVLAQASDWFVGHWAHEGRVDPPDLPPGLARVSMTVRADRTVEMRGTFTPDGATEPVTDFHMTAKWLIENADSFGLSVRLEDIMVSEDGRPMQPGDLETEVMNLEIRPDGTLFDHDDAVVWERTGP